MGVNDFTQAVTTTLAILSIVVLFVGAFIFVKGAYNKARLTQLREQNEDLLQRVNFLESEMDRLKASDEAKGRELIVLTEQNHTLTEMVTQRADVDAVKAELEAHHAEAMRGQSDIKGLLGDLKKVVGGEKP